MRWKKPNMNKFKTTKIIIILKTIILLLFFFNNSSSQSNTTIEGELVQFYNNNLPGITDFKSDIKYPKSPQYGLAWAGLVIAVSKDVAFIISVGQSEVVVKSVESWRDIGTLTSVAIDAVSVAQHGKIEQSDVVKQGYRFVVVPGIERWVGSKVPGLRTGMAVYGVLRADEKEKELVFQRIAKQIEIQSFTVNIAQDVENIMMSLLKLTSNQSQKEYRRVLQMMLSRRAEVAVYRQLVNDTFIGDAGRSLDYNIDQAIPGRMNPTMNATLVQLVDNFIRGNIDESYFDNTLRSEIKNRIGAIPRTTVEKVLLIVGNDIKQIKERRERLNRYGGGFSFLTKPIGNYAALKKLLGIKSDLRNQQLTIGLILDSSGSMVGNDPQESRKVAAGMIVDRLDGKEDVFLVDFDDGSTWLNSGNWRGWGKDALRQAISTIDASGGTNIGGGLDEMRSAFESAGIKTGKTGVLLLTDGQGDYINQADWFQQQNIPVYTISFIGNDNSQLLSNIANQTGGQYIKANSAADIVNAFNHFLSILKGSSRFCLYDGSIAQGEIIEKTFPIDCNTKDLFATLNWPGSTLELSLISPRGQVFTQNGSGAQWFVSDTYVSAKIINPDAGEWKANLKGISVSQPKEPYNFEVNGDSPLSIVLQNNTAEKGPIKFELDFNLSDVDVGTLKSVVNVINPKGESKDISNSFVKNKIVYHPLAGSGNYKIFVDLNGKTSSGDLFQRQFSRSILIGNYIPSYIGNINRLIGSYVIAELGSRVSNRPGVRCYIYPAGGSKENKIATGVVTYVKLDECTIEIQRYFGSGKPSPGYLVELDIVDWMNDSK